MLFNDGTANMHLSTFFLRFKSFKCYRQCQMLPFYETTGRVLIKMKTLDLIALI